MHRSRCDEGGIRVWRFVRLLTATACLAGLLTACGTGNGQADTKQSIDVLYAGSMTKAMEDGIQPAFLRQTGIAISGEGAGSAALAQMIESGERQADVFISASPTVNETVLMGQGNHNAARWFVTFARDSLVIAYSPRSRFADRFAKAAAGQLPWYQVLEQPGVRLGRTDPKIDPKGLSTIYLFELTSSFYHQPDLAAKILGGAENPSQVFPEESLLAQLTSGQLDAVIAYRHEAVEWGVPYVALPNAINLSDPAEAAVYRTATYRDASGKLTRGSPIVFTITIPATVQHLNSAEAFVKFLLSPAGQSVLSKQGFISMAHLLGGDPSAVPQPLQTFVQGRWSN